MPEKQKQQTIVGDSERYEILEWWGTEPICLKKIKRLSLKLSSGKRITMSYIRFEKRIKENF